jgi:hypothetical protein
MFFFFFSQSITVNTTSYTTEELVNEILINSPCVNATNVNLNLEHSLAQQIALDILHQYQLPFTSGVVLSTGDVDKVPAPNNTILRWWTGDADLENIFYPNPH